MRWSFLCYKVWKFQVTSDAFPAFFSEELLLVFISSLFRLPPYDFYFCYAAKSSIDLFLTLACLDT
jgi:hypothetical protein